MEEEDEAVGFEDTEESVSSTKYMELTLNEEAISYKDCAKGKKKFEEGVARTYARLVAGDYYVAVGKRPFPESDFQRHQPGLYYKGLFLSFG